MKKSIHDLALFGGNKLFHKPIHVAQLNIPSKSEFDKLTDEIWQSRILTNRGPLLREFELKLQELLHIDYVVLVNNATIGILVTAMALGLKSGDEVIAPSFTFSATAQALWMLGIRVIFCDINLDTHNIDHKKVRELITPKTKAILGVHLWGRPCDIDELDKIAKKNNLNLFFDSAHAIGCKYNNKYIGSFGDAEVFSMHGTKVLSSAEGGFITTHNHQLADKLRSLINFGYSKEGVCNSFGINAKMSELSAAFGILSLKNLSRIVSKNKEIYTIYNTQLSNLEKISHMNYNSKTNPNYQYNVFRVENDPMGISRDLLLKILHSENILARKYFVPHCAMLKLPQHIDWENYPNQKELHDTEILSAEVLQLPCGKAVELEDVRAICELIKFLYVYEKEISAKIKGYLEILS